MNFQNLLPWFKTLLFYVWRTSVYLWPLSWTLLAGGAPILTGPSWRRGWLQGGEATTFGFNNINILGQRNAVANTWSNMHVEPAAWPGEWRAQMKIMKINKLWKLIKIKTERKLSYTSLPVKLIFWRVSYFRAQS